MSTIDEIPEDPCAAVEFICLKLFDGKAEFYEAPVIKQEKRFELITLIEILDECCAACDVYSDHAETTAYLAEAAEEVVRQNRYAIIIAELEELAQAIYRVTTSRRAREFRGSRKRRPAAVEIEAMAELAREMRAILKNGVVGTDAERRLMKPVTALETVLGDRAVTIRAIRAEVDEIVTICKETGSKAEPILERAQEVQTILADEPLANQAP